MEGVKNVWWWAGSSIHESYLVACRLKRREPRSREKERQAIRSFGTTDLTCHSQSLKEGMNNWTPVHSWGSEA